jgi:antitoxin YefM
MFDHECLGHHRGARSLACRVDTPVDTCGIKDLAPHAKSKWHWAVSLRGTSAPQSPDRLSACVLNLVPVAVVGQASARKPTRTVSLYTSYRMATETTYTRLRANLAAVLDEVVDRGETVIVRRKGSRDVALVPASELEGLIETAHLLRSPANARRLLAVLRRARRGTVEPRTGYRSRRHPARTYLRGSGLPSPPNGSRNTASTRSNIRRAVFRSNGSAS